MYVVRLDTSLVHLKRYSPYNGEVKTCFFHLKLVCAPFKDRSLFLLLNFWEFILLKLVLEAGSYL